jgi:WD40 repeat protein
VLGLYDCRVWVWDLEKAEVVGGPFIGHNNPVWAVSFLDQEHIVSRSGFRTVQVWNVKTRERVTRMDVATGTIDSAVRYSKYFIP